MGGTATSPAETDGGSPAVPTGSGEPPPDKSRTTGAPRPRKGSESRKWLAIAALAVVAMVAVAGTVELYAHRSGTNCQCNAPPSGVCYGPTSSGVDLLGSNATGDLAGAFTTGSVQAFGSNSTSLIAGGVSSFVRGGLPYDTYPAAAAVPQNFGAGTNLTSLIAPYFVGGGVFPVGWNGTSWLVAGEATWGDLSVGAAVGYQDGRVTNLTGLVAPYFRATVPSSDAGIFIAGWDGTGWLIGGNNSQGASLIYLQGDRVTDLTPSLPENGPNDWVQMLAWNGTGWLIGGEGILVSWYHGTFTDLFPASPFAPSGGVFGFDWDGSRWLVGGTPTKTEYIQGDQETPGPSVPANFDAWINTVVYVPGQEPLWVLGGGGYGPSQTHTSELAVANDSGTGGTAASLTNCLPGAFLGGWVQFGADASPTTPTVIGLVGEGGTDPSTGSSHGAMGLLTVDGEDASGEVGA